MGNASPVSTLKLGLEDKSREFKEATSVRVTKFKHYVVLLVHKQECANGKAGEESVWLVTLVVRRRTPF